jgi:hypothetical protein
MTASTEFLKPKRRDHVMDLVASAGVDVSDWANYADGTRSARANPRYCYNWSFEQPGAVVVLSLWHEDMELANGRIVQRHNFWKWAHTASKAAWTGRARKMGAAIAAAWEEGLPVRVIICHGKSRRSRSDGKASHVTARELDGVPWAVTEYDQQSGAVTLTRGVRPRRRRSASDRSSHARGGLFPDELPSNAGFEEGARREVIVNAYERDPAARRACLRHFGARCMVCELVFVDRYGRIGENFIHVHHLRPLARARGTRPVDPARDLVPVCPNCHAMLHQHNPPMSIDVLRQMMASRASSRRAGT